MMAVLLCFYDRRRNINERTICSHSPCFHLVTFRESFLNKSQLFLIMIEHNLRYLK